MSRGADPEALSTASSLASGARARGDGEASRTSLAWQQARAAAGATITVCTDLSKEVAKPDAEWARERLQQTRTEFERQRREQRKVLQQLIVGIKELVEQIARRATPEGPAAKRVRPLSVEICSEGDEGSEVRPTALLVAEPSGGLGFLVGVPVAGLAEAQRASPEPPSPWQPPRKCRQ